MEVLEGHRVNMETLEMRQLMEHEILVIFLPSQTYVDTRIQTDTDTKQSNVTDNRFLLLYLMYCAHTLIFSRFYPLSVLINHCYCHVRTFNPIVNASRFSFSFICSLVRSINPHQTSLLSLNTFVACCSLTSIVFGLRTQ